MNLFQKAKAAIMHFMKNRHGCKLEMYDESVVEEQPLSTENITFSFCNINYLQDEAFISLVSDELKVPDDKVDIGIRRMIKDMRQDIICCIEYPYIDVYYRDTYYSFYSKKHCAYSRYCFRISFFSGDVNEHNFYDLDLSDKFYGYMVLRPTVRRVVGYTFLSPALFEEREFVCCLCKKDTKYIYRCFLTSSRSYKEYITQANKKDSREHFVCMAMPRFVWVCEMIDTKDVVIKDPKKTPVSNIMLFDATEGNASLNYFIMAKLSDRIIVRTVDNSQYHRKIYKQFMGNKDIFYTFDRNLKGEHTKWQD